MCQVMGNFLGGTLSIGIGPYSTDERMDPGDNGIYVIDGWEIVDRVGLYDGFVEQHEWDFDEIIRDFDRCMPQGERLGELLDSIEMPAGELEVGDEVWLQSGHRAKDIREAEAGGPARHRAGQAQLGAGPRCAKHIAA